MTDPIRPETLTPVAPAPAAASAVPTAPVASPAGPLPAGTLSQPAKRTRSGGGVLNVVLVIAAAVAIGGVAFAVGRSTAPASAVIGTGRGNLGGTGFPTGSFAPGANGQPGFVRGGLGGAGLTVRGTVESVDGDTLTIKTASGQTIEVTTDPSTTYHTQTPAAASDVQAGATVQVQLDPSGAIVGRPGASAAPAGPVGTAGSVTVIP